jgi:hypothetical protein
MIGRLQFRQLLESHNGDVTTFGRQLLHLAGVMDESGNQYRSMTGRSLIRNPTVNGREQQRLELNQISLRGLAEAMLGEDAVERHLNPNVMRDTLGRGRSLLEAGTAAVQPSAMSNINAFTGIAVGLLEAQILQGYTNPAFIGDKLAKPSSTRVFEGRKSIGVSRVGDKGEQREPGMPTKRVQVGERWISQPRTVENSLAIELTQEAVYLDLTGDLTREANDLGTWLGYRKEIRIIDVFIGVVNNYNFMGNAYNTYISAGYYDNVVTGNELLVPEALNRAEIKFRDMKDPQTNTRVNITPNLLVCQHEYFDKAAAILGGESLMYRDKPADGAGVVQRMVSGPSIYTQRGYELAKSALVYERINVADGLNQSASNAGKYWWLVDADGFMTYEENWPIRVQSAAPGQMDMIDRGIVLYVKADERGTPMVREPRKAVRCTG